MVSIQTKLNTLGARSLRMLDHLTTQITEQKDELEAGSYYKTFSKSQTSRMPKLSRAIVDKALGEMEAQGYNFGKRTAGSSQVFALSVENVVDLYHHRKVPKYRDRYSKAFVINVGNLKGGVSKTVSTVTLAHGLRTHPHLLLEDLRVLVVDLDPQSSATMFLSHHHAIGSVENTAAQAMLQNVSHEELFDEFIVPSSINGVDIIPASIEDAFLASTWAELCAEHLPNQNIHSILRENLINKLVDDYDFIFLDSGPHLDAFLTNSLAAADLLLTPVPPAQVDFHSTLKYLSRLPELLGLITESGYQPSLITNVGFMSKLSNKVDHKLCHSLAKEIFGGDMLDVVLPRLDGFERCGESFDTVLSTNPANYGGSPEALKSARSAAEDFVKGMFDRIEFIRREQKHD